MNKLARGTILMALALSGCQEKQANGEEIRSAKSERRAGPPRVPVDRKREEEIVRKKWRYLAGMETRSWTVSAAFLDRLNQPFDEKWDSDDPFEVKLPRRDLPRIDFLPGAVSYYDAWEGTLVIRNTPENLALVEGLLRSLEPLPWLVIDRSLLSRIAGKSSREIVEEKLGKAWVEQKLREIRVPLVDIEDTTFGEAVAYLEEQAREHDQLSGAGERKGVEISIHPVEISGEASGVDPELDSEGGLGAIDPGQARVRELRLRDVPVATVLQYMCGSSRIRYRINATGVTVLPLGSGGDAQMEEWRWFVDPAVMERCRADLEGSEDPTDETDPFGGAGNDGLDPIAPGERSLMDVLKEGGIDFPPESLVSYSEENGEFVMRNSLQNLELADGLLTSAAIEVTRERTLGSED